MLCESTQSRGPSESANYLHLQSGHGRIESIDLLRGLAILGILPINIQIFSMGMVGSSPPQVGSGTEFRIWLALSLFAQGKFITIFALLFGAGIVLMAQRSASLQLSPAPAHFRRMGFLCLIGLAHAYLLWSGDILVTYAICGCVVYFGRGLAHKVLLFAGLALLACGAVIQFFYTSFPALSSVPYHGIGWLPALPMPFQETEAYRGNWVMQNMTRWPQAFCAESFGFFLFTFWRVTGLMLAGMALVKSRTLHATLSPRIYWTMISVAVCAGIPATMFVIQLEVSFGHDWLLASCRQLIDYGASLLVSLGWIGAIMLTCRSVKLRPFLRPLVAVGRTALTNYLAQSLICTFIFYGHGLGLFGRVDRAGQMGIIIGIAALQVTISNAWMKAYHLGPAEWLWRCASYMRREPLRREPLPV